MVQRSKNSRPSKRMAGSHGLGQTWSPNPCGNSQMLFGSLYNISRVFLVNLWCRHFQRRGPLASRKQVRDVPKKRWLCSSPDSKPCSRSTDTSSILIFRAKTTMSRSDGLVPMELWCFFSSQPGRPYHSHIVAAKRDERMSVPMPPAPNYIDLSRT